MKKYALLLHLILFLKFIGLSQNPKTIFLDSTIVASICPSIDYFKVNQKNIELPKMAKDIPFDSLFVANTEEAIQLPWIQFPFIQNNAYWLRCNVESKYTGTYELVVESNQVYSIVFFECDTLNKLLKTASKGNARPYSESQRFDFFLKKGEKRHIYLFIDNQYLPISTHLNIVEKSIVEKNIASGLFEKRFIIALFILALLFAVFLISKNFHVLYRFYFVYALSNLFYFLFITNLGFECFWSNYPSFQRYGLYISTDFSPVYALLLMGYYLNFTTKKYPYSENTFITLRYTIFFIAFISILCMFYTQLEAIYIYLNVLCAVLYIVALTTFWGTMVRYRKQLVKEWKIEQFTILVIFVANVIVTSIILLIAFKIIARIPFLQSTLPKIFFLFEIIIISLLILVHFIKNGLVKEERERIRSGLHNRINSKFGYIADEIKALKTSLEPYNLGHLADNLEQNVINHTSTILEDIAATIEDRPTTQKDDLKDFLRFAIDEPLTNYIKYKPIEVEKHDINLNSFRNVGLNNQQKTLVQEAFTEILENIEKHAHNCTHIEIVLKKEGNRVVLSIKDDGIGFDEMSYKKNLKKGVGLLSLQRQVKQLGGTFLIKSIIRENSDAHTGTSITITFPIKTPEQTHPFSLGLTKKGFKAFMKIVPFSILKKTIRVKHHFLKQASYFLSKT